MAGWPADRLDADEAGALVAAFTERRVCHLSTERRDRFADLLGWDRFNALLSLNLFDDERMRLVKDSRPVPPVLFRRDNVRRTVDAAKFTDLLLQGASLNLNRIQDIVPEVRRLAAALERWLDEKINVNAYLSMAHGGAFAAHYDTHDVLVFQVHGHKLWTIYDQPEAHPLIEHKVPSRRAVGQRAGVMEIDLRQGDLLFVPRGVYHKAAVQDDASVHLTFGIHTGKGIDLVETLRKHAAEFEELRVDLSPLIGAAELAERERRIKDRLHAIVEGLSVDRLLADRAAARRQFDTFGIGPAGEPAPGHDACILSVARQRHDIPLPAGIDAPFAERLLERLAEGRAMRLSDLQESLAADADRFRATVAALVAGRLVEYCRV